MDIRSLNNSLNELPQKAKLLVAGYGFIFFGSSASAAGRF